VSPPLVLIHGMTGAPASWRRVVERLPLGARVLAPALLGHEPMAPTDTPSDFDGEVRRIDSIVAAWSHEPVHVVGYSLGARVALGLALHAPERVARVTLIGVHPGLGEASEREERVRSDERWARLIEERGLEAFVDAWQAQPLFASQATLPDEVLAEQRRLRLAHAPEGLTRALRALGLGRMPCYETRLAEVACPARLVAGALDERFRRLAERAQARLPHARVEIVDGVGHNVVVERPRRVAELCQEPAP
jgi:2-succinyl-6-hydroxy-2,4-cyclohexadiene-1-carboxylate synthase